MKDGTAIVRTLDRLVDGMVALRHGGEFDEPNLDGTPGDYISFDSWEWPQGVGLYGLVRYWEHTGDARRKALIEAWYDGVSRRAFPAQREHDRADARSFPPLGADRRRALAAASRPLGRPGDGRASATEEGGFQHVVSDGVNPGEIWDDTLFMVCLFLAAYSRA